jgi:hypothetical protein
MLRAVVRYRRAIDVSVSPALTTYARNVGSGVGVGRTNEGGPDPLEADAGEGVGVAATTPDDEAPATGVGLARRLVGGMHAPVARSTVSEGARSLAIPGIAVILPQPTGSG